MSTTLKFLPGRRKEIIDYGSQVHDVMTAAGFDPKVFGLTAADVTDLGTLVQAAQDAQDAVDAARMDAKAKTLAMNSPGGIHDKLKNRLRDFANAARISNAPDDVVMSIGVSRRDPSPTPKNPPAEAPEFNLDGVARGVINVRFRESGSGRPRARAANTNGVQIAVVDATKPSADGEADAVKTLHITRSPAVLDSSDMPDEVRLYARWVTPRGLTSPWSEPLGVVVA